MGMGTVGSILGTIGGLIVLVCHIIVIVKMFQKGQTVIGIVAIVLTCCFGGGLLLTLIYGWIKATEWNIKNLMIVYTLGMVFYIAGAAIAPPDIAAIRKQLGQ